MHCETLRQQLDDYLTGHLPEATMYALSVHLQHCESCREHYLQTQKLLFALRTLPVTPARAGYVQRVLSFLPHTRPARPTRLRLGGYASGFAAALLLVLVAGFMLTAATRPSLEDTATLTLPASGTNIHKVDLVFHSPGRIAHANLRLELPTGIEINGFARQRVLQWQTTLQQGDNRLVLPLRITGHASGMLTARLTHDGHCRVFRLHIINRNVSSQRRTSEQAV